MITKHFFKMVITFIGVLLVGIVVIFAISLMEGKSTEETTGSAVSETTIDLNN
ncbi:MAG: hypothetical protein KBC42_02895 [Candidatus Pacebacteria bacterium]|nr:hypothetical protein [Candidatus Paceibacterota bacterium]MBP9780849.1 hypothetical protein [Candidatus Paceibacterota bacterium]